jgi:hypothetical protein
VLFGGSSTKMIELILFILGSWLVIVVDVFFLLNLASVELDGNRRGGCGVVEPLTLSWGVQCNIPDFFSIEFLKCIMSPFIYSCISKDICLVSIKVYIIPFYSFYSQ